MNNLKIWQVVLIVTLLWLLIASGTFHIYPFIPGVSGPGVFGDSFGVVNSLFSGLAFALLFYSTWLQRKELESQRTELELQREELMLTRKEFAQQNETMKIQRVDSTFFKMLELIDQHHEINTSPVDKFSFPQLIKQLEERIHSGLEDFQNFYILNLEPQHAESLRHCNYLIDSIKLLNALKPENQIFYLNILSSFIEDVAAKKCLELLIKLGHIRTQELTGFHLEHMNINYYGAFSVPEI